jgi:hypothetical protein
MVIVILVLVFPSMASAQQATPGADTSRLTSLGYSELTIRTESGEITIPEQVEAGRTLIAYENVGGEASHPILVQVPEAIGLDRAVADLGPEAMEPPAWFLDATFPGFVGETLPGETSRVIVDLVPGDYLIVDDAPFEFEVVASDATPAGNQAPPADRVVTLFEMGFDFSEALEPGQQVWEVANEGSVPHELLLVWSPEPVTAEQALELVSFEDSAATPSGGGPSLEEIVPIGGMGWLSPGMSAWTEVTLETGTYIALCFVFDPETGMPHAMQGMVDIVTVGEGSSPAATPAG